MIIFMKYINEKIKKQEFFELFKDFPHFIIGKNQDDLLGINPFIFDTYEISSLIYSFLPHPTIEPVPFEGWPDLLASRVSN